MVELPAFGDPRRVNVKAPGQEFGILVRLYVTGDPWDLIRPCISRRSHSTSAVLRSRRARRFLSSGQTSRTAEKQTVVVSTTLWSG